MIKPGEEIIAGNNQRFVVRDVVPFDEEDEVAVRGAPCVVDVADRGLTRQVG